MVYKPDPSLLKLFDELVRNIFDLRYKLCSGNETLKKSRDILLSRLITGKLSVEDLDIKFPPSMGRPESAEGKEADA
jgi:type I restriction enzyme S subunit